MSVLEAIDLADTWDALRVLARRLDTTPMPDEAQRKAINRIIEKARKMRIAEDVSVVRPSN